MLLRVADMQDGYRHIARMVASHGEVVAPRGQPTREVLGATIVLDDPRRALPIGIGRKPNLAIAAAEALQLLGGVSYPELMVKITKNFAQFRDGGVYHGAYGPRVRPQLPRIVERLQRDPESRQAIITIWDPAQDTYVEGLHDYPCTVALQYMIRDGRLVAHTFMRSNDVWWGLAYDAFQFTQLQLTIAHTLNVKAGPYYHHANSLHVYERDVPAILNLHPYDGSPLPRVNGLTFRRIEPAMACAREILEGRFTEEFASDSWYGRTLEPYL